MLKVCRGVNPDPELEILGYAVSGEECRAFRLGVPGVLEAFVLFLLKMASQMV